jgi:hypothetical protein
MNNAYMVSPGFNHPINTRFSTPPMPVPAGTQVVRFSVVPTQPMRRRPQYGVEGQIGWTDAQNRTPIRRDKLISKPKGAWSEEEQQTGLPDAGHTVGKPLGAVSSSVGPFAYEIEQSPSVSQSDVVTNPAGFTHVFLEYYILGGSNGGPVFVSIVLEAFSIDENGGWVPLEFT